ncbi:MAG TPA: zinc-binding alcohol dehydrogenase family protein [Planctomycetota bacterium]
MKAIQLEKPGSFRTIDLDEPAAPGPGEALLKVLRVGVCGTDFSGFHGRMPFYSYPRIPGHELGVEVVAVGPDVRHLKPGDRCAVEPYLNCQACFPCRRGHTNCCESLQTLGVHTDGGLRPRVILPARKVHPAPGLSPEQLALVETLGIGCHAVDRAEPKAGDDLLIIGAGPIGLSALDFAKLSGAKVAMLDVNPARLEFAKKMGLQNGITLKGDGSEIEEMKRLTNGSLFAQVIDATGNQKSMSNAMNYCAFSGRLVFVGITQENLALPHPLMHRRELTVMGSRNAVPDTVRRVIAAITAGKIDTTPWVTHTAPFDGFIEAFPAWTRPETGVIKAMVTVQ